jgi:hypothetical protein
MTSAEAAQRRRTIAQNNSRVRQPTPGSCKKALLKKAMIAQQSQGPG